MQSNNSLPHDRWVAVIRGTIAVTLISGVLSVILAEILMLIISKGMDIQGAIAAFLMPIILATPVLFHVLLKTEQLKQANKQLEAMASTDWLTGCLNRRAFTHEVDEALKTRRGTLLVIDADHFKWINDQFGHEVGDRTLQLMAEAFRRATDGDGLVGRLGGEEFGILLVDHPEEMAALAADAIRLAITELEFLPGGEHRLSVSIGGAHGVPGTGFAEMFRIADERLYAAKAAGRNRIHFGAAA
jgi:diguanylate cyclase